MGALWKSPAIHKKPPQILEKYLTGTNRSLCSTEQTDKPNGVASASARQAGDAGPRALGGHGKLPGARRAAQSHGGQASRAGGGPQAPFYPSSLLAAAAALSSQQRFLASVLEPSQAPDPLAYSNGHTVRPFSLPIYSSIHVPTWEFHLQPLSGTHPSLFRGLNPSISSSCVARGRCQG